MKYLPTGAIAVIKILENIKQAKEATYWMRDNKIPLHDTMQKNWDHYEMISLLKKFPKSARILDMGSGHGFTLKLLHTLGYENISGIDYALPRRWRLERLKSFFFKTFSPYSLIQVGDLCNTKIASNSCDFITCISVIEHGVDEEAFVKEASRLLKPEGQMWVTFDYWEPSCDNSDEEIKIFGLPWIIFDREKVKQMIRSAKKYGLELKDAAASIPECREKTLDYFGKQYTFMGIAFKKNI
jgi:ubiquinone/menaquinone biosynthesis C-methylase UbiE